MDRKGGQRFAITSSISMLAICSAFLVFAPLTKYPLDFEQSMKIIQVIIPLFAGYLASASMGLTSKNKPRNTKIDENIIYLMKGVFFLIVFMILSLFIVFGVANWPSDNLAYESIDFSFDSLSLMISLILGIHTATTTVIVGYLFGVQDDK